MTTLSFAIVSYNTRDLLARCLDSIRQTAGSLPHEVIVVDNGSPDGSARMVREQFPGARLVEPGRNTWYSAGNNLAIHAAAGEFVLVLNPDTEVHPGAAAALLARLQADPGVGLVTARQVWTDGSTLPIGSRFPALADLWLGYTALGALLPGWRARRRTEQWYADWDRLTSRPVEVAPGSCLLARRDLWLRLGGFDERMPMYFSDDDLCARVRQVGLRVEYAAEAVILHHERASARQIGERARQMLYADLGTFARKHYGPARAALLMAFAAPTRWAMEAAGRLRGG